MAERNGCCRIGGARFELLAHTYDAEENHLASGFKIFASERRRQYVDQVAIGEAASLDESKALAEDMVRRPRSLWPALTLA